jgi:nitrogen fixation/metabolism regulation signal transduction histidine kinase
MDGDAGKTKYRRRTYVIDREFQYRYMTTWILMTLAFVAVNALVLYWGARTEEQRVSSEIVLGHLSFMMRAGAIFVICVTVFLGCLLLLLSHRIAGPAYRIRKCMSRITKGDYSFDVRLRKRDYLKGVADAMNDMIAKLRERRVRLESMRALWRQVAPAVQSLPDGGRIVTDINKALDDLLLVEPPGEETKSLFVPRGLQDGAGTTETREADTTQR